MEITIEQNVYPRSETKEVLCMVATREHIYNKTYGVSKLGICYQFTKIGLTCSYKTIKLDGDTVLDPTNTQQEDWQLLKILNPEVDDKTWKIYHVLKDLIDNKIDEEYTLERISDVLQKENI